MYAGSHRALISGGRSAKWALLGSTVDFDLVNNRAAVKGKAVSVASQIAVTRGSAGLAQWADGHFTNYPQNVARETDKGTLIEDGSTNSIRNNSMVGAVVGTPGTLPTNWNLNIPTGVSRQIIGTGTDALTNLPYIDVRVFGTNISGSTAFIDLQTDALGAAALTGQQWVGSFFLAIVGGSPTGISSGPFIKISEYTSGLVYIGEHDSGSFTNITVARQSLAATLNGGATTAAVQLNCSLTVTNGSSFDITLRVIAPQLEGIASTFATSPIMTTTAAAARLDDIIQIAGAALPLALSAKSAYIITSGVAGITSNARLISFNPSGFVYYPDSTHVNIQHVGGGATVSSTIGASATVSGIVKTSASFVLPGSSYGIVSNGGTNLNSSGSAFGSVMGPITIGNYSGGGRAINGYLRRLAFSNITSNFDGITALALTDAAFYYNFAGSLFYANGNQISTVALTTTYLTTTRASSGLAQYLNGNWASFGNGVPRMTDQGLLAEPASTNVSPNNQMQGAVLGNITAGVGNFPFAMGGSPGVWSTQGVSNGIIISLVGSGTEFGLNYIDVNWNGTPSTTAGYGFYFDNTTVAAAASSGQTWTTSVFARQIGSATGVAAVDIAVTGLLSNGSGNESFAIIIVPTAQIQRFSGTGTFVSGTTARVVGSMSISYVINVPVNVTYRIYAPQTEQLAVATSPILTANAAVARLADVISTPIIPASLTTGTMVENVVWPSAAANANVLVFAEGNAASAVAGATFSNVTAISGPRMLQRNGATSAGRGDNGSGAAVPAAGSTVKFGMSWDSATTPLGYINGVSQSMTTGTPAEADWTGANLSIGSRFGVSFFASTYIKTLAVFYNTKIPAAQLQGFTT